MKFKTCFFLFLFGVLLYACQPDKGKDIPDVSNIQSDVKIHRFEQDLFQLDTLNMEQSLANLSEQYPEFSKVYFGQVLGSTDPRIAPQGHEAYVKGFINFPALKSLYDTCQVVFSDMQEIKKAFDKTFKFHQYYFPNKEIPSITTFISEYTIGAFIYGENALAVGLDFFLGENYPYLKYNPGNSNFSQYLTRTFNKDHIVLKTLIPYLEDAEFLGPPQGNRLLDLMVHKGKQIYILEKLMPETPDSVLMEFSQRQIEWVEDNELEMWAHLLSEELLYSTNYKDFRKLVEYSPHSKGMPPEAPGRTAVWLGWKIVKKYMERNPELSLQDLINTKDAQEILTKSKYKPPRG